MARFMSKIERSPEGCWLWTAALYDNGYAVFKVRPKQYRAHRWIVEQTRGPIPEGAVVMHTCDIRRCVNPDHLVVGSQADNQADMTAKGRGRTGDRNGMRDHPWKLSRELAGEIRRKYRETGVFQRELAHEYGVSQRLISKIIRGEAWADQTERIENG